MNPHQIAIATFETIAPAEKLVTTLAELGIQSQVNDETGLQRSFLLQKEPHASVHVLVEKHDVVRAETAMRELRTSLEGLLTCPACQKSKIVFPQFTRKFADEAWLMMLLCRAGIVEPEYFCESCSHGWSAKLPTVKA